MLPLHLAHVGSPLCEPSAWTMAPSALAALLRPLALRMEIAKSSDTTGADSQKTTSDRALLIDVFG